MVQKTGFEGFEFDWFCVDRSGQFALFATGGKGLVPDQVLAHSEAHVHIGDSFRIVNWGTKEVWQSYTAVGLYVYDWDSRRRAYIRIAKPMAPLSPELEASFRCHENIPKLNVDFDYDDVIEISSGNV